MKRKQPRRGHAIRYEGSDDLLAQADAAVECGDFSIASQLLERALQVDPSNAPGYVALGKVRLKMRGFPSAESLFRSALRLDPRCSEAAAGIVSVHLAAGRLGESETLARSFAADFPDDLVLGQLLAQILQDQNKTAEAVIQLEAVSKAHPESMQTLNSLGKRLSELGRFGAAIQCFERAIALDLGNAFAYLGWVQSKTVGHEDSRMIESMESLRRTSTLSNYDRMLVLFALGKAYGDLGKFSDSMTAYREANEIRDKDLSRKQPFRKELYESFLSSVRAVFTEQTFHERQTDNETSPIPIFICGMFRSGTTLIEQILSSHSTVAAGGEIDYWLERGTSCFDFDQHTFDFARAKALRGPYQKLLRGIAQGKPFVTDKMPGNYRHIGLLRILFPNAKFVHCSRHPIATCLSIYMTSFKKPPNYAGDLEKLAVVFGYYRQIMDHWRAMVKTGVIHEIRYEQLVADPEGQSRNLLEFCGLEFEDLCLTPERNQAPIHTASAWQARQPIYRSSEEKWRSYEPWLGDLMSLIELEPA